MGFRLTRRIKIAPGINLNLSKSGISTSIGPRGAKFTVGTKGTRSTVGIPGTGIYYSTAKSFSGNKKTAAPAAPATVQQPDGPEPQPLNPGFFKNLILSKEEKTFIEGCKAMVKNDADAAYAHFNECSMYADARFMAGIIAFKQGNLDDAEKHLLAALENRDKLGVLLDKYHLDAGANIQITDEISAYIQATQRGIYLALTEIYQHQGNVEAALNCLFQLRQLEPNDIIVKLSLIEIYFETGRTDKDRLQSILNLTQDIGNETPMHTAILLYRARALRMLGLNEAAREILTAAMKKKKDRTADLLHALQYERGLVYEDLGKPKLARKEFEKLYAENPNFEGLSQRLGLE